MSKAAVYIVATPIGNVDDISPRATRTLKEVDLIAAEDTRRTGQLLQQLQIPKKTIISYHDHVEQSKASPLIEKIIREDLTLALVSDAGTPCISDPGYRLVAEARKSGVPVHPIPGPSALTALVSASGLPSDRFAFIGFPPTKEKALRDEVRSWGHLKGSVVFYESTRRLQETLTVIGQEYPASWVAVGRELTKLHEEIQTLPIQEALVWAENHKVLRGEATVMVYPNAQEQGLSEELIRSEAKKGFSQGQTLKDLLKTFQGAGLSRSALYQLLLEVKQELDNE